MKTLCMCRRCTQLVALALFRELIGDQDGADYLMSNVTILDDGDEGYTETWSPVAATPVAESELN